MIIAQVYELEKTVVVKKEENGNGTCYSSC